MAAKKHCPKYDRDRKDLYLTSEFQQMFKDNQYLFEAISNATGEKVDDFISAEFIYNTLFIERLFNLSLPAWTEKFYPQPLNTIAGFSFSIDCYNRELARLKVGKIIFF